MNNKLPKHHLKIDHFSILSVLLLYSFALLYKLVIHRNFTQSHSYGVNWSAILTNHFIGYMQSTAWAIAIF